MNKLGIAVVSIVGLATVMATSLISPAGDLYPPKGEIMPTMVSLETISEQINEITDLVALVRQWIQRHDPTLVTGHWPLITDH